MGGRFMPGEYAALNSADGGTGSRTPPRRSSTIASSPRPHGWSLSWSGYSAARAVAGAARRALDLLAAMATLQAGLGIATLLTVVDLPIAVVHQAGAVLLVTAALYARHRLRRN